MDMSPHSVGGFSIHSALSCMGGEIPEGLWHRPGTALVCSGGVQ
jgi:hypothetical protein